MVLLSAFVACCAASAQSAESPQPGSSVTRPVNKRGALKVGATSDNYPYSYVDADGNLVGFAVDLLDAVARIMNLRIERTALPGRVLHERFTAGEFDFLQLLSQTEIREAYADFTVPFLTLQGAIFVQKKNPAIRTLNDFNNRKFAVIGPNSIAEQFFRDKALNVEMVYVNSTIDGLRMVESGECAGVFASQLTALSVMAKEHLHNTAIFGHPIANYDVRHCFAVHKGDAELLARLNEGLAILHRTGEFDRLNNRWFGQFNSTLISRQQAITYGAGVLALGLVAALWGLLRQRALRHRIARQAAELSGQQALLQTLYDNIPMAMCVIETSEGGHRILSVNRQAEPYFGKSAELLAGQELSQTSANSEWMTHLNELLQRGLTVRSYLREERNLAAVHKRLIFTLVPMTPGPDGKARLCVLAEDVTERRNLDDEIAQTRKLRAIGELVGGIAHEFNNLLTPIMLKVGQIELDWSHDRELLAETRLISEAVHRSAELTRRLLTFGRKADHHPEPIHVPVVIANCFALLKLTIDRRIQWEQNVPKDLPSLFFSTTDLNQILLNLIINARDTLMEKLATSPADWTPLISVSASLLPPESTNPPFGARPSQDVQGWQQLTVRDNGMGMTSDVVERIFEPFFTTKDIGQGTGLGLATVWHLVTEASGRVEVESAPGKGTAFHVYLPMLQAPMAALPVPSVPNLPPARPIRIFLADDDAMVASAVTAALTRAGHSVTHFPDGASAWQYLRKHLTEFDLLILDVNMPGLDGIELASRIRATARFPGHIIIASGRLSPADLKLVEGARVDRVLNKPFATTELLDAINQTLVFAAKR